MICPRKGLKCSPRPKLGEWQHCGVHDGLFEDRNGNDRCHAAQADCKEDWILKGKCYWHIGKLP